MSKLQASRVRALVRAALVCAVAFGAGFTGPQVAACVLVAEAALQLFVRERI